MFDKLKKIWNDKGYEILIGSCLVIILVLALFKIGKKGTWSSSYNFDQYTNDKNTHSKLFNDNNTVKKTSSGELECRRVLRKIFNKPFNTSRPNFLRNPVTSSSSKNGFNGDSFNLELDCFEPSLRLGIEYQGAQHYKYIPYFHKNKESFRNQQYRDELKRRMCRDNRINLIEVPHTVKIHQIESYLRQQLKIIGYL
jgi:hypothetical protein